MAKVKKEPAMKSKPKSKGTIAKRKNTAIISKLKKLDPSKLKEVVLKKAKPNNSVLIEDESIKDKGPTNFVSAKRNIDEDQVNRGVSALYEYMSKRAKGKAVLFEDEELIFLQVTCIKVPSTPYRQLRLTLPHSLLTNASSEICLIVKDVGKRKEHEETIEHFEKILKEKNVTNIKTIMPLHQFETEYGNQFELKRKLLGLYDHFLVDGKVSGPVVHLLGKIFSDKRQTPTPIRMETSNLKEHIDQALRKTMIKIHSKGDSYAVQVGHNKMTQDQVYENIIAVVDELTVEFPGGFENIRALGIKGSRTILIPIYLTLKNKSAVLRPIVKPKRPKEFKEVRGELSTFLEREVTVLPSGEVVTHVVRKENGSAHYEYGNTSDMESDALNSDDEEEIQEKDEDYEDVINEKEKDDKNEKDVADYSDEEEEDDILAQTEAIYLNQYEEEVQLKKKSKKNKQDESKPLLQTQKKGKTNKATKTIKPKVSANKKESKSEDSTKITKKKSEESNLQVTKKTQNKKKTKQVKNEEKPLQNTMQKLPKNKKSNLKQNNNNIEIENVKEEKTIELPKMVKGQRAKRVPQTAQVVPIQSNEDFDKSKVKKSTSKKKGISKKLNKIIGQNENGLSIPNEVIISKTEKHTNEVTTNRKRQETKNADTSSPSKKIKNSGTEVPEINIEKTNGIKGTKINKLGKTKKMGAEKIDIKPKKEKKVVDVKNIKGSTTEKIKTAAKAKKTASKTKLKFKSQF